jgi:excisionase family DNA binding protein
MGGTKMHRDETVLAVGMVEAARRLGLSARTVATLVSRHELPSRKVGRRRIIPIAALEAFIELDHLNVRPVRAGDVERATTG